MGKDKYRSLLRLRGGLLVLALVLALAAALVGVKAFAPSPSGPKIQEGGPDDSPSLATPAPESAPPAPEQPVDGGESGENKEAGLEEQNDPQERARPEAPAKPEPSDIPEPSGIPKNPDIPENPDIPGIPGITEPSDIPEPSGIIGPSDVPQSPDIQRPSDIPGSPEMPEPPASPEPTEHVSDEPSGTEGTAALKIVFAVLLVLLAADLAAAAALTGYARRIAQGADWETPKPVPEDPAKEMKTVQKTVLNTPSHAEAHDLALKVGPARYGKAHNIGARPAQQDSLGQLELAQGRGLLAVVADGMGGLSGGEQVSQAIVRAMLSYAAPLKAGQLDGVLPEMVKRVNEDINRMLGPDGLYKSGSTLVSVLVQDDAFQWLSVGDSRIYFYRDGRMTQLNQEHTLLQEWMPDILNGKRRYEDAARDPDGVKLTSFIGMGRLKHVDASQRRIRLRTGDRLLLMSDGVFNTLPETAMEQMLAGCPDVQQAADLFEQTILKANMPGQDNFTAIILGF